MRQSAFPKDAKPFIVREVTGTAEAPAEAERVPRLRTGVKIAVVAVAATVAVFATGFVLFWNLIEHEPRGDVRRADGIVALTGGEARIPEAVKLLSQGKGRRLLISGVNPATTRRELAVLTPNSQHLFRCCVDVDQARDTVGNAQETSHWATNRRFKSLIVVTASYHMPRSLAELRRTLPDVVLIPYPVRPRNVHVEAWWAYPGTMQLLLSEYMKFIPAFARCYSVQFGRKQGFSGSARQCANVTRPA
jgi:uncharacterized SAM-binding protein YcdF (DUF218 family)